MALGLIVNAGRILTAKLLMGQDVEGLTHCAIGDGDETGPAFIVGKRHGIP